MKKPKVLVFPCGTEVGLTIGYCLEQSQEIELWGASSEDDHGRFVFDRYIQLTNDIYQPEIIEELASVCQKHGIDYIYPAHDEAVSVLSRHRADLNAEVIAPDSIVCRVCRSKTITYELFPEISPAPFDPDRPIRWFAKPDKGQGSKGCFIIEADDLGRVDLKKYVVREYLPGPEFTVDCFTDRYGKLRFCEGRSRERVKNGISVRTKRVVNPEFRRIADLIGSRLKMRGQWFFQVKEDSNGDLKLLEIAARPAGSSLLWFMHGVSLPQLTVKDRTGQDVQINFMQIFVEMDRRLGFSFSYTPKTV